MIDVIENVRNKFKENLQINLKNIIILYFGHLI